MGRKICRCGLPYVPGLPAYGQCPRCEAHCCAMELDRAKDEPFGSTEEAAKCLTIIMACVATWPQLLIIGDQPGPCEECENWSARLWQGLCDRCMLTKAEEERLKAERRSEGHAL